MSIQKSNFAARALALSLIATMIAPSFVQGAESLSKQEADAVVGGTAIGTGLATTYSGIKAIQNYLLTKNFTREQLSLLHEFGSLQSSAWQSWSLGAGNPDHQNQRVSDIVKAFGSSDAPDAIVGVRVVLAPMSRTQIVAELMQELEHEAKRAVREIADSPGTQDYIRVLLERHVADLKASAYPASAQLEDEIVKSLQLQNKFAESDRRYISSYLRARHAMTYLETLTETVSIPSSVPASIRNRLQNNAAMPEELVFFNQSDSVNARMAEVPGFNRAKVFDPRLVGVALRNRDVLYYRTLNRSDYNTLIALSEQAYAIVPRAEETKLRARKMTKLGFASAMIFGGLTAGLAYLYATDQSEAAISKAGQFAPKLIEPKAD